MTKRNHFTKIVSFLMALVMTLGMFSMTAFAGVTSKSTGKITIDGLQDDDATNAKADIYQIITVNTDDNSQQPKDPEFMWVPAVATWLKANGYETLVADDGSVNNTFSKDNYGEASAAYPLQGNAAALATLYDKMAAAIGDGTLVLTSAGTRTGNGDIGNLAMGNYLVLISGGKNVYRPSTANIVPVYDTVNNEWKVEDATVVIKSTEPSITKTVDKNKVAIGDTVTYTVTADVPVFPENANNKKFFIGDLLSEGLTLDADSIKVVGLTDDAQEDITTGYTQTTANATNINGGADLTFSLDFEYNTFKNYKKIQVTYTAKVNENVVTGYGETTNPGNLNTAYLEYTNKPYGANDYEEDTAEVKVYSYGMDLTKVDKNDADTTLEGAEFTLTNADDTALTFTKVADGQYKYDPDGTDTLTSGTNGKLVILGLNVGKYTLTETKAPAEYNIAKDPFDVTLTADGEEGAITDHANGILVMNIQNSKGFSLPSTGGMGTVLFTVAGIALIALGAGMIVIIKKRNGKTAE